MRELSDSESRFDALVIVLYVERKWSIPHVCSHLGIGQARFYEIVKRRGIQVRGEGGSKPKKIFWSQELLDQIPRIGISATAKRLQVSYPSLESRLNRAITRRQIIVVNGRLILVGAESNRALSSMGVDSAKTLTLPPPPPVVPAVAPPPKPASEPEPEVYVGKRRVTEQDVRQMLRNLGEEELQAYVRGETPRNVVYERTRVWLRERIRAGITR
jgi:hypothetical protein